MELEFIHLYDTPGNEVIRDQVRYVSTDPYGLDNAQEVMLYCPGGQTGRPAGVFSPVDQSGPQGRSEPGGHPVLLWTYNVNESEGFAGYDG